MSFLETLKSVFTSVKTYIIVCLGIVTLLVPYMLDLGCPPHLHVRGMTLLACILSLISCLITYAILHRKTQRVKSFTMTGFGILFVISLVFALYFNHNYITVDSRTGHRYVIGDEYLDAETEQVRNKLKSIQDFHEHGNFVMNDMYSSRSLRRAEQSLTLSWFASFIPFGIAIGAFISWIPKTALTAPKRPKSKSKKAPTK